MAHADYDGIMAQVYDRGRRLPDASVRTWVVAAARHLPSGPGPVLDLGAGTGRFSVPLAEGLETTVVGLEPAGGMRAEAVTKAASSGVALVAGTAEALPFRDRTFRGVWASQVIHHLPDLDACARELRRVLVDGGRLLVRGLYVDVSTRWCLGRYFPEAVAITEERFPSIAAIRQGLASAGFEELAHDQIDQVVAETTDAFYRRTALRADSALALMPDVEFEAGLSRLGAEIEQGSLRGPVSESLDLLVFE
ncbi:MAG: class I SAM-dependent methyltransferase [Acidimicrobiales bacterium]